MFADEETRRIMRAVAAKPGIHVNELISSTGVVQNSFYPRIQRLLKGRLVREERVLNKRTFHPTKKGLRTLLANGIQRGKEFIELLNEIPEGRELLTKAKELELEKRYLVFMYREEFFRDRFHHYRDELSTLKAKGCNTLDIETQIDETEKVLDNIREMRSMEDTLESAREKADEIDRLFDQVTHSHIVILIKLRPTDVLKNVTDYYEAAAQRAV